MRKLVGLPLDQVSRMLEKENIPYKIVRYRSYKPYDDADSCRVLRALPREDGYELIVGEFKTEIDERSQG